MEWIRSRGWLRDSAGSTGSMKIALRIALAALAPVLVCACGSPADVSPAVTGVEGQAHVEQTTAAVDARWAASSRSGRYRITIRPEAGVARIGALHSWIVEVVSSAGEPVRPTYLVFDGGMPQHGHGFETRPRVTDSLGPGVFRVDGIRFQMAGSWKIRVDVAAPAGVDFAMFDVEVGP